MAKEVEIFDSVFDDMTRNSNAIDRIMSSLHSENPENPVIRELGNIYLQSLGVQRELSRTYGDKDAMDYVDRRMNAMRQELGLSSGKATSDVHYPKLNSEEIYEGMVRTYNSMDRLMSDIYSNDPGNPVILDIGQQVALGYLEMQKSFAESYLPQDSRDIVVNGIENKKVGLANTLSEHMISLSETQSTRPTKR